MGSLLTLALTVLLGWQAGKESKVLAPYYPTPEVVVEKMLEFGLSEMEIKRITQQNAAALLGAE